MSHVRRILPSVVGPLSLLEYWVLYTNKSSELKAIVNVNAAELDSITGRVPGHGGLAMVITRP